MSPSRTAGLTSVTKLRESLHFGRGIYQIAFGAVTEYMEVTLRRCLNCRTMIRAEWIMADTNALMRQAQQISLNVLTKESCRCGVERANLTFHMSRKMLPKIQQQAARGARLLQTAVLHTVYRRFQNSAGDAVFEITSQLSKYLIKLVEIYIPGYIIHLP
jgi:hypothetical protein